MDEYARTKDFLRKKNILMLYKEGCKSGRACYRYCIDGKGIQTITTTLLGKLQNVVFYSCPCECHDL